MSFRFHNQRAIDALLKAGFKGFKWQWNSPHACPCCVVGFEFNGMMFPEPKGVTTSQHKKNVSLALWAAGIK